MSVSRKIWVLFFIMFSIIILLFATYYVLKGRQNSLYLSANVQSMNKILDSSFSAYEEQIFAFIRDYSSWDELASFTRSRNENWATENMESALSNYHLSYLNVFNLKEELIYSPLTGLSMPGIDRQVFDLLRNNHIAHFFVSDNGKIVEIFAATINRSTDVAKTEKQFGFFMVGFLWDDGKIRYFENTTGFIIRLDMIFGSERKKEGDVQLKKELFGIDGKPVAELNVYSENKFIHEAKNLANIELISFLILTLILLMLTSATIHRHIALPLKKLARALQFNDPAVLKTIRSNDEFSDIARMVLNSFQQEEILINETIQLRELEASLRESEKKFHSYFNNSPESIVIMNDQGKILEVNQATLDFSGFTYDEIRNQSFIEYLHPDDYERGMVVFRNLPKEQHHQHEFRIRKKNGDYMYVSVNSYISKENEFISFCQDITALKMKELALKESEEKFMTLFYSTPIPILILNMEDQKLIDVNEAFEEIFGYNKNEVVGHTTLEMGIANPEDRKAFYDAFNKTDVVKNLRYRFTRKNDTPGYGLLSGITLMTGNRKILLATITDVTELKKAEDKLSKLNQTLEERVKEELEKNRDKDLLMLKQSRLAAMGETIHNIAHQWRQPLNALGILIQNIKNHLADPDFSTVYINTFEKKSMDLVLHLSRTIDDFRNFFKIDRDMIEFRMKDVILQTVGIIDATYKNNYIRLELDLEKDMTLMGYPNEYAQVLLNVLNNSKEAFLEKKVQDPCVKIEMNTDPEGKRSVVRVTDNAGGIPENIIGSVFDPYFTTKNTGTGIGLYMSKYIIEKRMNGKISLRNISGGVEVRIEI